MALLLKERNRGVVLKSGDCGMEADCCSSQMSFFKRLDPSDRNNNYDRIDPNNNCDPGDQNNNYRSTEGSLLSLVKEMASISSWIYMLSLI
ncbi:hypothetical protein AVEN_51805-1 [Araneus ventricosus]|uniref:Uncharacterized protein n=1 Tax=Araneus ventricosus TaxID=182803 RepID=A0A4Y2LM90_ARAVE|nr:hypothetical protein AVEN_51805-1 [Araneus ventricosus]